MRVAIYIRVSRIDLHPENQRLELERFAKAMGYDYKTFEEKEIMNFISKVKDL